MRDDVAQVLVRESVLRENDLGALAFLEEFYKDTRDGHAHVGAIPYPFRDDDLLIGAVNGVGLARAGDLHCLPERSTDAKVHLDLASCGVLAAGPLLQHFRLRPPAEHGLPGCIKDARDLQAVARYLDFGFHDYSFPFCCSFLSSMSSASKLKFQPAAHAVIHRSASFKPSGLALIKCIRPSRRRSISFAFSRIRRCREMAGGDTRKGLANSVTGVPEPLESRRRMRRRVGSARAANTAVVFL